MRNIKICKEKDCTKAAPNGGKCSFHKAEKQKKDNPVEFYLTRFVNNNSSKNVTVTVKGLKKLISEQKGFKSFADFLSKNKICSPRLKKRVDIKDITFTKKQTKNNVNAKQEN